MTVWALFDSGNGSYTKGVKRLNKNIEIYPIGIDIENKNNHFINLNLADYSRLFGDNALFDTLDKLPKPDLIIASPPCESWSNASAMDRGNACWKQEQGDALFQPQQPLSIFTVRDHKDFDLSLIHILSEQFRMKPQFTTSQNGTVAQYQMKHQYMTSQSSKVVSRASQKNANSHRLKVE